MKAGKRAFIKSVSLITSQEQSKRAERRLRNSEDFILADRLINEIKVLAIRKKSGFSSKSHAMSKYTEDNIPFYLLSNPSTLIRRFASVLIGLIFEEKSDLFRYKLHKNLKNACIEKNKLYLSNKTPAIRQFRPEPLYHVESPFMYYLPLSTFPKGLTCYLDFDKLCDIVLVKEWMRLPDPQEHLIWMNFEETSVTLNLKDEESHDVPEDSVSADIMIRPNRDKGPQKVGILRMGNEPSPSESPKNKLRNLGSIGQEIDAASPSKKDQNNPTSSDSVDGETSGVHRIKCFQFFRKQKTARPNPEELGVFKELLQIQVPNLDDELAPKGSYLQKVEAALAKQNFLSSPDSPLRRLVKDSVAPNQLSPSPPRSRQSAISSNPPQFESVNDWATDKDYAFYSTQMKFLPVRESLEKKSKLREIIQNVTESQKEHKSRHEKLMHNLVTVVTMKQLVGKETGAVPNQSSSPAKSSRISVPDQFRKSANVVPPQKATFSGIVQKRVLPVPTQRSPKMAFFVPELLKSQSKRTGSTGNHSPTDSKAPASPQPSFRIQKLLSPQLHAAVEASKRVKKDEVVQNRSGGIVQQPLPGSQSSKNPLLRVLRQKPALDAMFEFKRASAPQVSRKPGN